MDSEKILDKQFVMTDTGRVDRIRDLYTTFNPDVDLDALKASGYPAALDEMMEPVTMDYDDHAPKVIAYWAKRGLVKEFHGEDTPFSWTEYAAKTGYEWHEADFGLPQNRHRRWNSFVPVSAFKPENKGKKYPVVVMLHGGMNPVSIIDGWGIPQEAARREWIVIVPSIELDDVVEDILKEAEALYPINRERIYVAGFSYGGFMTNYLANKRPDIFAAAAVCGAPVSDSHTEKEAGAEPQPPYDKGYLGGDNYMPVINVSGNLDGYRFPIYNAGKKDGVYHVTPEQLTEGINHWARVNKATNIDIKDVYKLAGRTDITEAERFIGIPLAEGCGRRVDADGLINYIGDLKSTDGDARVRIMVEMNMPHWPTPEMARQIFEFFSHFKRNRETGESIHE